MQSATGELDNTARLRGAKRELARALTVARQRGVDPNVKRRLRPTMAEKNEETPENIQDEVDDAADGGDEATPAPEAAAEETAADEAPAAARTASG